MLDLCDYTSWIHIDVRIQLRWTGFKEAMPSIVGLIGRSWPPTQPRLHNFKRSRAAYQDGMYIIIDLAMG